MSYELELFGRTFQGKAIPSHAVSTTHSVFRSKHQQSSTLITPKGWKHPKWSVFLSHQHAPWTPRICARGEQRPTK